MNMKRQTAETDMRTLSYTSCECREKQRKKKKKNSQIRTHTVLVFAEMNAGHRAADRRYIKYADNFYLNSKNENNQKKNKKKKTNVSNQVEMISSAPGRSCALCSRSRRRRHRQKRRKNKHINHHHCIDRHRLTHSHILTDVKNGFTSNSILSYVRSGLLILHIACVCVCVRVFHFILLVVCSFSISCLIFRSNKFQTE